MKIVKNNGSVEIPNWLVLAGLLLVDNVIGNICITVMKKKSNSSNTEE